jgi:hypothetical protein
MWASCELSSFNSSAFLLTSIFITNFAVIQFQFPHSVGGNLIFILAYLVCNFDLLKNFIPIMCNLHLLCIELINLETFAAAEFSDFFLGRLLRQDVKVFHPF